MDTNRKLVRSHARHPLRAAELATVVAAALLAPTAGCDDGKHEPTETGAVLLSVDSIPDGVACVRVTAAGEFRQVVTDYAVTPGASLSESLSGLPVGKVLFSANAYSQACESTTKSTTPMWLSDQKSVNVVQGKSSSVTLILYKNGRAKVSVEFADQEDGGTDAHAPSTAGSDAGSDGGVDAGA
jgi:hypothetical protein